MSELMRLLAYAVVFVFLAGVPPASAQTAATERAVLDQYCVTCHNEKLKTANLSLQSLDLASAGDHPEIWEQVIRKLRAGMMPPPGMPRPPLAKYEQLRDWLEAEMDRKAAAHPNPGAGDAAPSESHRIRQRYPRFARSPDGRRARCFLPTIRREALTTSRGRSPSRPRCSKPT